MEALRGTSRLTFLGFFASHIAFTICIDSQAILPESIVPDPLKSFLTWYATTMNDPFMSRPQELLWFQSMIACEVLFQLPFFFWACLNFSNAALRTYSDAFRCACIAYGGHTATTLVPILAIVATNPEATPFERLGLACVYLPYLIFPLAIMWIAATSGISTGEVQKKTK